MLLSVSFSLSALLAATEITWPTAFFLLLGMGVTTLLVLGGMFIGLVLGTLLASFQVYGPAWGARLVGVYVWFFRGVPILVLMFMFYFGLSVWIEEVLLTLFDIRVRVPAFGCAVVVLGLCSTAYQSQIFRGAMQSIPAGQFKAAQALGLSQAGAVRHVILPQVWRIAIPAWSNEYSILLKDSAIAFVIGTMDLMSRFKAVASTNHRTLLMYILAGLAYYLMTWVGVELLLKLYHRVRIPGLAEVDSAVY